MRALLLLNHFLNAEDTVMFCSHPPSGRKSFFPSGWELLGEDLQPTAFFGDRIS